MSAPLKRRVALLEALLEAEKGAHSRTFIFYREALNDVVELKLRNKAALAALQDEDYFEGGK